jgi:hypothetical protein
MGPRSRNFDSSRRRWVVARKLRSHVGRGAREQPTDKKNDHRTKIFYKTVLHNNLESVQILSGGAWM